MSKRFRLAHFYFLFFLIFFLSPFIFLIYQFRLSWSIPLADISWVAKNTIAQSFFSALISTILGLIAALGLLRFPVHSLSSRLGQLLAIVPFFVPPLFVMIAILQMIKPFPYGIEGVVLIHVILNFGFAAVLIRKSIEQKLGNLCEMSEICGASFWFFMRKVFFQCLWRDLLHIFGYVFVICFTSFSIPMVVGGTQAASFEIFIYEILRYSSDWSNAVGVALLQTVFLFLFNFLFSYRETNGLSQLNSTSCRLIAIPGAWVIIPLNFILLFGGYVMSILNPTIWIYIQELQKMDLWNPVVMTFLLGIASGVCFYLLSALVSIFWFETNASKLMPHFVGPTTALVGFFCLIVGNYFGFSMFTKLIVALVLSYYLVLCRTVLVVRLEEMIHQIEMAEVLGADTLMKFKKVILPNMFPFFLRMSSVGAVWAMGDFAVSRIILPQDLSLALVIDSLLSQYRLDQALLLGIILFSLSILVFLMIERVGYVAHTWALKKIL